jgi:hypothetical protein
VSVALTIDDDRESGVRESVVGEHFGGRPLSGRHVVAAGQDEAVRRPRALDPRHPRVALGVHRSAGGPHGLAVAVDDVRDAPASVLGIEEGSMKLPDTRRVILLPQCQCVSAGARNESLCGRVTRSGLQRLCATPTHLSIAVSRIPVACFALPRVAISISAGLVRRLG